MNAGLPVEPARGSDRVAVAPAAGCRRRRPSRVRRTRPRRRAARAADPGGDPGAGGSAERRGGPRAPARPARQGRRARTPTRRPRPWLPASRGTSTAPGASWGRCSGPRPICPPRWAPRWPGSPRDAPRTTCCSSPPCFVVLLALGWIAERLVGRLLAGVRGRLDRSPGDGLGVDAGSLVIRVVLDLLLLAVFVATVFAGFLALYQGHEATRELIVSALLAIIQVRLAILIARVLLAPHTPAQRLLPFDDAAARSPLSGPGHPRLALRRSAMSSTSSCSASACRVSRSSW